MINLSFDLCKLELKDVQKKSGTNDTHTDGHCNLETKSAQWANSVISKFISDAIFSISSVHLIRIVYGETKLLIFLLYKKWILK